MLLRWLNKQYDITQRVDNGINFMDGIDPYWRKFINVDELRMSDPYFCIGGQYINNVGPYPIYTYNKFVEEFNVRNGKSLGFEGETGTEYYLLTLEWHKRLTI